MLEKFCKHPSTNEEHGFEYDQASAGKSHEQIINNAAIIKFGSYERSIQVKQCLLVCSQKVCARTRSRFRASVHLSFKCFMCGMNNSLRSKTSANVAKRSTTSRSSVGPHRSRGSPSEGWAPPNSQLLQRGHQMLRLKRSDKEQDCLHSWPVERHQ